MCSCIDLPTLRGSGTRRDLSLFGNPHTRSRTHALHLPSGVQPAAFEVEVIRRQPEDLSRRRTQPAPTSTTGW